MKIIINNKITLKDMPLELLKELKERLSFVNPKWLENDKRGFWNGETPKTLRFYEQLDNGVITLPRGYIRQLLSLCKRYGVNYQILDNRRTLYNVNFTFNGTLRPFKR